MGVHERRDVEQEDLPVRATSRAGTAAPARPPPVSSTLTRCAVHVERALQRRPVDAHPGRVVAVGVGRVRTRPQDRVAHHRGQSRACRSHVGATVSTACHEHRHRHRLHAAPLLGPARPTPRGGASASRCRTRTRSPGGSRCCGPEQVRACVSETHSEERVLAAEPYPGAVEAVRRWHEAGHFIHITSHRATASQRRDRALAATGSGCAYDELYCSEDKVARCREIGIDVLIDDSPENLAGSARRRHHRRDAPASLEPRAVRDGGRHLRGGLARAGAQPGRRCSRDERPAGAPARAPAQRRTCATTSRRSSRTAPSPTGAARSGSRAWSTRRSPRSSTTTGSAARSRGSSTCRPPAARCWSPTTPARSRPTRR